MREDIKNAWVEALESGDYAQTRRALKDYRGFCCLGVLCDVLDKKFPEEAKKFEIVVTSHGISVGKNRNNLVLSDEMIDEYAIPAQGLMDKNDGTFDHTPAPFKEIAAYIRENVVVTQE